MKRTCIDCGAPTEGTRCGAHQRAYRAPYHSREYRQAARDFKGRPCEIGLPGCTGLATTVDHVVPKARVGGRGPLRPACAHCNSSRQARREADMDREGEDRRWGGVLDALAKHRGVVVLDDLGREKVSDWTGEAIYALVNGRYERLLPTIVTTNLTGAELAASPYWPVVSRLAEDGELVRVEAPDHRLAQQKARRTA